MNLLSPYGDLVTGGGAMRISSVRDVQVLARSRRQGLGLTQHEVAERAGVSRKWLVNFESGTAARAELSLVLRLLATLDVPVEALLAGELPGDADRDDEALVDLDDHLARLTRDGAARRGAAGEP
jgi:transcriptional regulator with XRE-family HTH domain